MDWRAYYKEHTMTPEQAVSVIHDGDRVVFGHAVGEPIVFQRTMARIFRGHPFIVVPDVVSSLSREKVMVSEFVTGAGFDAVKAMAANARAETEALRARLDALEGRAATTNSEAAELDPTADEARARARKTAKAPPSGAGG